MPSDLEIENILNTSGTCGFTNWATLQRLSSICVLLDMEWTLTNLLWWNWPTPWWIRTNGYGQINSLIIKQIQ